MRFSVSVGAVFNKLDMISAMKATREAGLDAVEFWGWWDKDIGVIKSCKDGEGLCIAALCTRFISLVDPGLRRQYIDGLKETIEVAVELGCPNIISQVGDELPGISRDLQHRSLVDGLKECAPLLRDAGVTLVFEPLNTIVDHGGYYLSSADEAFRIEAEVACPNVKVLYDIYHQQIMDGHLIARIRSNIARIGHFHAAGNPGRHELSIGEIHYPAVFAAIDHAGYQGFVGLEYMPVNDPAEGLKALLAGITPKT